MQLKGPIVSFLCLTLVVILTSCGGGSKKVSGVSLSTSSASVAAGTTAQVTVTVSYSNQTTVTNPTGVTFTSSDSTVATVDTSGLVTTLKPGTAIISASFLGTSGTTTITVSNAVLNAFTVSATNISLPKGLIQTITLTGKMTDGSTAASSNFASCTWTAPNGVATLASTTGASNTLTAAGVGSGTLTITCNGITQTSAVTVTAAVLNSFALSITNFSLAKGRTQNINLAGALSDGTVASGSAFSNCTWTAPSAVATLATTIGASNTLAAAGIGSGTLTVTCSGITQSTPIAVTAAVISRIDLSPTNPTINLGDTQQFTATATFTDNTTQNVTSTATWASGTTATATMDSSTAGLAHGVAGGTSTITATKDAVSASTLLTVNSAALGSYFIYGTAWDSAHSTYVLNTYDGFADGTVTLRSSIPFKSFAGRIVMFNSRFLYLEPYFAQNSNDPDPGNKIAGYSIDQSNGNLTPLQSFTVSGTQFRNLSIDPSGQWMVGFDFTDSTVPKLRVLAINSVTGALSDTDFSYSLPGYLSISTTNPAVFMRNSNGTFFYFGSAGQKCANYSGSGTCTPLWAFSMDPATGSLSLLPNSPYASSANSPQVYGIATNRSLLWVSYDAYRIATFSLDQSTGVPTEANYWWPTGSGMPIEAMAVQNSYFYAGQGSRVLWIKPAALTYAPNIAWSYTDSTSPRCMTIQGYDNLLLVGDGDGIASFQLDDAGLPTFLKHSTLALGPMQLISVIRKN